MFFRKWKKLFHKAKELENLGQEDKAIELYKESFKLNNKYSFTAYNLALIYKYRKDWKNSFYYNQIAYNLEPKDEATIWNLGISATALKKWDIARKAWGEYSNTDIYTKDTGPIEVNFGLTPIRIQSKLGEKEVVWGDRIDPARVILKNIPYAGDICYGDILLIDGAPDGKRIVDGKEYEVFNMLDMFEKSDYQTFSYEVICDSEKDFQKLEKLCILDNVEIEDWTDNVRMICEDCSKGIPHEHKGYNIEGKWKKERNVGFSTQSEKKVKKILEEYSDTKND